MAQTFPTSPLLVVDDDPDLLRLLTLRLTASGYRVVAAEHAEAALAQLAISPPALVITDVRLPGMDGLALFDELRNRHPTLPVILLTAHGTIPDAVDATARGAFAYLTKPFDSTLLLDKVAQALSLNAAPAEAEQEHWRAGFISRNQQVVALLAEARLVAASDASVLIRGESGTGKELLARVMHRVSPRAQQPFISVNCGAVPEQLLESELFGHVPGAFSGALAHQDGACQAAAGGTLFLDEIGDLPPALQTRLLRVLQERAVQPMGASQAVPVEVRIIAATHQDLARVVAEGQFREDLYYRLDVVTLTLPTLEARREDIALLANHFLQDIASRLGKPASGFAPDALALLSLAQWPGNVRQLYNVVEQVCVLSTLPLIPASLVQRALQAPPAERLRYAQAKQKFERDYLIQLLRLTDGNVSDAARLADRNRTEFYRLLQKNGLEPRMFRGGEEVGTAPGHG